MKTPAKGTAAREMGPIGPDEGLASFTAAFRGASLDPIAGPVILAVSGGADSMAMLSLAALCREALRHLGIALHVATVDHGLRAASTVEAEAVGHAAASFGLAHRILRWEGAKPRSNLQEAARSARYALLVEAAEAIGATVVLTAHHQDDQIETHALASERRAGDRGLAGMRARRMLAPGLDLVRPFLGISSSRMRATAEASGLPVFEDPSNRDERFARVRLRHSLAAAGDGERAARLAAIAAHRAACEAADLSLARALGASGVEIDGFGRVRLAFARLGDLQPDLHGECLGRIVAAVGGAEHPPGRGDLERLGDRLLGGGLGAATLGGVRVEAGDRILFSREFGRNGPLPVAFETPSGRAIFDGRFNVSLAGGVPDMRLSEGRLVGFGALGRGNPAERTMPVLLDREGSIVAVPHCLSHKAPGVSGRLHLVPRVGWRLWADLPRVEKA